MNLIESIVHNLSRNKFENSGQYKILIMQTIQQHKDYRKFGDEITSELNKLKITSYHVTPPLRQGYDDYKCVVYLGTEDWKYNLHFKASNLEGLQAESIMIHYLRLGEVPIIHNIMDQVYMQLEEAYLGDVTLRTTRIKQAITDAYKKEYRDEYESTKNRLRSEAHILMCSDELKDNVDTKRRSQIRQGVMACLIKARTMARLDDIHYFLRELEIQEIMDS